MIQKALLIGVASALAVLFAVNLAVHRPEAFFLLGWASAKLGNVEFATRMFETGLESSKTETPTKDRLRVSDGVALTLSGFDKEAVGVLSNEVSSAEGDEKRRLESFRLLALGNARAKDAVANEGIQRKMQLYGALVAYTGAYSLTSDEDAKHNYEIVKKLFDEQVEEEKQNEKKEEQDKQKQEEEKKDEEERDNEKTGESKKDEKKDQGDTKDPDKNAQNEEGGSQKSEEPPKTGNWTNGGNPASLNSDPGGTRGSNSAVPLSPSERAELEESIRGLAELQKNQGTFVRPDGKPSNPGTIPNSLRELFSGDPFFDSVIPDAEQGKNGKTW